MAAKLQLLYGVIAIGVLFTVLVKAEDTEECDWFKQYESLQCGIKSGDYSGSELSEVLDGGDTKIKLTVASLNTEDNDIKPTLEKIANGIKLVPKIGSTISGVLSFMISIFGGDSGPDRLETVVSEILTTVEAEITDLYNYIDEQIALAIFGDLKSNLKTVADIAVVCEKQLNNTELYDEDDVLLCLENIQTNCISSYADFITHHDNVIDYELTFPLMRDFGHICSAAYNDLLGAYDKKDDSVKMRNTANHYDNLLNNFIDLYDNKLDVIIQKHTSNEHRHSNLHCCMTEHQQKIFISLFPFWRTKGFTATCTEYFGHRSVALDQEKCHVERYVGCNADPNTKHLDICWTQDGSTFQQINCAKGNALYITITKLESYWDEYRTNRGNKLRAYWQKTVGDVVDKWRVNRQKLDTITARLMNKK